MNKVSLLPAIVTADCLSRFTCIQDSLEQSGRSLLQAFAQNAINNECTVHIFCTEHPVQKLKDSLRNTESSNVHFHDCFSDPQSWIKYSNTENVSKKCESELSITSILENVCNENRGPRVIIVESLTPYVLNNGFMKCYQEFNRLLASEVQVSQIVCLVHEDTLPAADRHLPQLAYLATTYITVSVPAVANIVYKKPGGRIIKQGALESGNREIQKHEKRYAVFYHCADVHKVKRFTCFPLLWKCSIEVEEYAVSAENKVTSQVVKPSEVSVMMKQQHTEVVPDDLTTFRLSLGQQEKEARSQLVLPYIRKEQNTGGGGGGGGGGHVYYQPDAADDWDEEDPDDDLDI